jgi:hypothetical protein
MQGPSFFPYIGQHGRSRVPPILLVAFAAFVIGLIVSGAHVRSDYRGCGKPARNGAYVEWDQFTPILRAKVSHATRASMEESQRIVSIYVASHA